MDKNKKDKFAREYKKTARNNKPYKIENYFNFKAVCDCGIISRCEKHGY